LAVCFLGFALPVMVVCCCCCCCRSNQNQNKRKPPQDQLLQAFSHTTGLVPACSTPLPQPRSASYNSAICHGVGEPPPTDDQNFCRRLQRNRAHRN
jgi:hypothetical protein